MDKVRRIYIIIDNLAGVERVNTDLPSFDNENARTFLQAITPPPQKKKIDLTRNKLYSILKVSYVLYFEQFGVTLSDYLCCFQSN